MATKTAFQVLLRDMGALAMSLVSRDAQLPRSDTTVFRTALNEAVIQYLAIALQTDPNSRKTIYGYVSDYYPCTLDASLRKFYRHEKTIRVRAGQESSDKRHLYDPAEFLAIQNRVEQTSPLVEAVLRENAHLPKNLSNFEFARIYDAYDREYRTAAGLKDDRDYVFASIYFYRLEHALALSLISNIAEHMASNHLKGFDFEKAAPFLTDTLVPDIDSPASRTFCAWPNLLSVYSNIPHVFFEGPPPAPLMEDYSSRVLKQNILERLPHPEHYGTFDLSEAAAFLRKQVPVIASHRPVSFYLNKKLDNGKIKLARAVMRQFYSFSSDSPSP